MEKHRTEERRTEKERHGEERIGDALEMLRKGKEVRKTHGEGKEWSRMVDVAAEKNGFG